MSRLAVLRRPLSNPALESDLDERALDNPGPTAQVLSLRDAGLVDVQQDPDRGGGIERAGRHRTTEVAVQETVSGRARATPDDAFSATDAMDQHGLSSSHADRTVTGGWVPSVSERLQQSGYSRERSADDAVLTAADDLPSALQHDDVADEGLDDDGVQYAEPYPTRRHRPAAAAILHDPRERHHRRSRMFAVRDAYRQPGWPAAQAGESNAASRGREVPAPTEGRPPGDFAAGSDLDVDDRNEDDRDEDDRDESHANDDEPADEEPVVADPGRAVRARRVGRSWGRFAELWVPEPLRDARVDPGRRGAIVLLMVATLAAVVTAFGVWRDRPEPRPVESSAVAALALSAPPSTAASVPDGQHPADETAAGSGQPNATGAIAESASSVAGQPTEIVVSVTGLVEKPGIVTLPAGARVAEAIAAAGGAAEGADLTGLNLAARLADGDSVVVGNSASAGDAQSGVSGDNDGQSAAAASGTPSGGLVNLNTADEAALDTLPGVGPVMAKNILAWRAANGKFTTVEQLQEITGIGPSRYAQLSPLVTVS
jgi:competence protein ComEA